MRVALEGRAGRTRVENGRHEGKRVEEAERRTRARVMYCSHLRQALRASSAILRWCTRDYTSYTPLRGVHNPDAHTCTRNCRRTWMHARVHRIESRYVRLKRSPAIRSSAFGSYLGDRAREQPLATLLPRGLPFPVRAFIDIDRRIALPPGISNVNDGYLYR